LQLGKKRETQRLETVCCEATPGRQSYSDTASTHRGRCSAEKLAAEILMNLMQLRTTTSAPFTAKTFFEHVCPVLFGERADLCQQLGGRYSFTLAGSGGGAWTLDFSALEVEPAARQADLAVSMKATHFEALLAGSLDAGAAIRRGELAFSGNRSLFGNLAAFTKPPQHKK
jgi:SCP-2 sterol transfer family